MKKRTKFLIVGAIILTLLFIIMLVTSPSKEKFDKWLLQEHGIDCSKENICYKDGEIQNNHSSHFRDAGIFASWEINFKHENGGSETYRTFGIFGSLIEMNDGFWWDVVD